MKKKCNRIKILLFGDLKYGNKKNQKVIAALINNILESKNFEGLLL